MQKVKDSLFWKLQFDNEWNIHRSPKVTSIFSQEELDKQRLLWREKKGRLRGLSPRLAAYEAFKELINRWYIEEKDNIERSELLDVASVLYSLCPHIDENGAYQRREDKLDEPWKSLSEEFWTKFRNEKAEKENFAKKIASYKFSRDEIYRGWETLNSGEIPKSADQIWAISWPRKSAKEIIDATNVSMEEFVFWACVFREYLGYTEQVVMDEHMYCRPAKVETLYEAIKLSSRP